MSTNFAPSASQTNPITKLGRAAVGVVDYVGSFSIFVVGALRSIVSVRGQSPSLAGMVFRELGWMFTMGLTLVGLLHIGVGSFLSMQAYYGGTFVDGTGAVVGVGLFRNVAPMMAGLTLAGLLCARITPELRLGAIPSIADELGLPRIDQGANRRVAAKLIAGSLSGFVLTFWACLVGTVIGWRVAIQLMGVSTHSFFVMFRDMIWVDDIVGALCKGLIFGGIASAFACYEGLRWSDGSRPGEIAGAAFRATWLSWIAILFVNSGWFLVFYHAVSPFGPTLMAAPNS